MKRLEVSGAVRPLYGSLGVKGLKRHTHTHTVSQRRRYLWTRPNGVKFLNIFFCPVCSAVGVSDA